MKPHSQKFLEQRRFYMVLPLLVLPFITMIFWALGGGKGSSVQAQEIKSGLNLELPSAHFKKEDELWDKFALYEQAMRDSLKLAEAKRNDPYYVVGTLKGKQKEKPSAENNINLSLGHKNNDAPVDQQEEMIEQKLQQLSRQLDQPVISAVESKEEISEHKEHVQDHHVSADVAHLEKMMQLMSDTNVNDPEMQQIEGLIDKILDLQHPDRVRDRMNAQQLQYQASAFSVAPVKTEDNISMVEYAAPSALPEDMDFSSAYPVLEMTNDFYGLDDNVSTVQNAANAIQAVIHETQTVVAGSTIKMRLATDVTINGQILLKDQFIYGTCAINGERLSIIVNSIRHENALLPVALTVHDLDGLEGIYIPGAISRDAAKEATSQSVNDVQLFAMDNSLGAQAATAGVEAAKGLFSKKARLIKVTVKAGYQLLLRDTNTSPQ